MSSNKKAFEIEEKRQELAEKMDIESLKLHYKRGLAEIKDLNTPDFWDKQWESNSGLDYQDPMTQVRIKTVIKFIPKGKLTILDIGAGLGWTEELIDKDKEKKIYANDFSPKAVRYLKKNFKGDFSVQSIYNLKYKKDFFDVILALEVLEHIPPSKIFSVLKSISSFLKKEGVLVISVPMNEGLEEMKINPSGHVRMYTEKLITTELKIAGFRTVKSKTLFAFSDLYKTKSFIARVFKTHKPNNIVVKAKKV